jgi:methionyl-tRNA formyltransferase
MKRLCQSHPSSWPKNILQSDAVISKPRTPEDARVNWSLTAIKIDRLVRALGWRGWVRSELKDGKVITIERVQIVKGVRSDWVPGKAIEGGDYPLIGTQEGLIRLLKYKVETPIKKGDILSVLSNGT